MPTFALNFSRPGAQVVAQYYNFLRLGFEGYRKVQQYARDVATRLAAEIEQLGPCRPTRFRRTGPIWRSCGSSCDRPSPCTTPAAMRASITDGCAWAGSIEGAHSATERFSPRFCS